MIGWGVSGPELLLFSLVAKEGRGIGVEQAGHAAISERIWGRYD